MFGLRPLPVVAATVAFFVIGFLWYGIFFTELWMAAEGVTEADAEGQSPIWMLGGFILTLMQVIGLGLVLKWKNTADIGDAVTTAVVLWFLFALPFVLYAYVYLPSHNLTSLLIDGSHLLVGWIVSAVILTFIK